MTSPPGSWEHLTGGPCDGLAVWASPACRAIVVTRDSDRVSWHRHNIETGRAPLEFVATEAHLYVWSGGAGYSYMQHGLSRSTRDGRVVWELRHE